MFNAEGYIITEEQIDPVQSWTTIRSQQPTIKSSELTALVESPQFAAHRPQFLELKAEGDVSAKGKRAEVR